MRISNLRARTTLAILAASLSVMGMVGPIAAATPQNVTLVSSTIFNPDGPNFGTFVATGDAVDQGLICATGTFVDTFLAFAGYENDKSVQITVGKTYTCPAGTFFVKMQIHANFDGTEVFTWIVRGGTGPYVDLRGSGQGTTVPNEDGNVNTFVGLLLH
jgi:hypothetical protein